MHRVAIKCLSFAIVEETHLLLEFGSRSQRNLELLIGYKPTIQILRHFNV